MTIDELVSQLEGVHYNGTEWAALCPNHDDHNPSLSVAEGHDGRLLVKCFAGCEVEEIVDALGLKMKDLFPKNTTGEGNPNPASDGATVQPSLGLTLGQYAEAKRLPEEFLVSLGIRQVALGRSQALRIPYRDNRGVEVAVRYRHALEGSNRFRWQGKSRVSPYGLWKLAEFKTAGYVVLVEGESDCHTLWLHEVPALGIPGAATWQDAWISYLDGWS